MPAAAPQLQLKANYRPTAKLEVFYTGGAARITRDGKLLACTCSDEVKVGAMSPGRSSHRQGATDTSPVKQAPNTRPSSGPEVPYGGRLSTGEARGVVVGQLPVTRQGRASWAFEMTTPAPTPALMHTCLLPLH